MTRMLRYQRKIKTAPGRAGTLQGPDQGGKSLITTSVPKHLTDEVKRTILREAVIRYRNEILDDEERQELQDRIGRLRRSLRLDNGR